MICSAPAWCAIQGKGMETVKNAEKKEKNVGNFFIRKERWKRAGGERGRKENHERRCEAGRKISVEKAVEKSRKKAVCAAANRLSREKLIIFGNLLDKKEKPVVQ